MPRDYFFFSGLALLLVVPCSVAESLSNQSKNSTGNSWVCDLGHTTLGVESHGGWVDKSSGGGGCSSKSLAVGFAAVVIAVVLYGSNFIPVKRFDTGDGMFFQWMLCIGIWLCGLVINFARQQPPFFYPAVFGAICWTTGNLLAVPIIKLIGMTMGLTVWGIFNMLSGWLQGLLLLEEHPKCEGFNYGGLATIIVGVIVFGFVTSEGKTQQQTTDESGQEEKNPLIPKSFSEQMKESTYSQRVTFAGMRHNAVGKSKETINGEDASKKDTDYSWVDKLGFWPRRICGFGLSVVAGLLFSFAFTFIQLMEMCTDKQHKDMKAIDYTFSLFTGILLASSFWFIIYCIYKKNKPVVYPKVILPGLVSGIMWGMATAAWIVANSELSLTVSYPLVSSGPGALSSLYGIIWFREIKGLKNIILYLVGLVFLFPGAILIGLSKCHKC